jgi:hypothetical protein
MSGRAGVNGDVIISHDWVTIPRRENSQTILRPCEGFAGVWPQYGGTDPHGPRKAAGVALCHIERSEA